MRPTDDEIYEAQQFCIFAKVNSVRGKDLRQLLQQFGELFPPREGLQYNPEWLSSDPAKKDA